MKKKIIYLVANYRYVLTHRLSIIKELSRNDYQVTLITKMPAGAVSESLPNLEIIDLDIQRSIKNPLKDIKILFTLCRIYRRIQPVFVQHISLKTILLGSLAARWSNVPYTFNTITGLGYLFVAKSLRARMLKRLLWPVFFLIFQNKNTWCIFQNTDDLEKFVKLNLIQIKNTKLIRGSGVDIERFRYSEEQNDEIEILFASRILRDKGVLEFVEAARLVKAIHPAVQFSIAGEVDDENPAKIPMSDVRHWEQEGLLKWYGHEADMPSLLKRINIVCLPSYREGLPKILLEAASCGRAIITTDVPGCRDAVIPDKTALLVPAKDARALSDAINLLINDENCRKSMGREGRKMVEQKFSDKIINQQIIKFYEQIISDQNP